MGHLVSFLYSLGLKFIAQTANHMNFIMQTKILSCLHRFIWIFSVVLVLNQNINAQIHMHVKNHHRHVNYFTLNYSIYFILFHSCTIDSEKKTYSLLSKKKTPQPWISLGKIILCFLNKQFLEHILKLTSKYIINKIGCEISITKMTKAPILLEYVMRMLGYHLSVMTPKAMLNTCLKM